MAGFSKRQLIKHRSRLYLERWLVGQLVGFFSVKFEQAMGFACQVKYSFKRVRACRSLHFLYLALALTSSILFMLQYSPLLLTSFHYQGRSRPVKRSPTTSAFMELTYAIVSLSTVRYWGDEYSVREGVLKHKC